jgi:DnaJ-class molecular chaperone
MEMESSDFYRVLGVSRRATLEDIKKAYREIARVYHPDSNFFSEIVSDRPSPEVVDRFKQITDAYNTLSNEDRRKMYDLSLGIGLKGWEEHTEDAHESKVFETVSKKQEEHTRAEAFGTFGNNVRPNSTIFDSVLAGQVRPMSEIIGIRRGPFHRILKLLGLR